MRDDLTAPNKSKKDSARTAETIARIKKAFFELYAEKRIDKISIREITDLAGVNRGTFYSYFLDIYDLKETVENEAFDIFTDKAQHILDTFLVGAPFDDVIPQQSFVEEHRNYVELIMGTRADAEFVERVKNFVKAHLTEKLAIDTKNAPPETIYTIEYIISAQFGLIRYWYQSGMALPIEELALLLRDINFTGALKYLMNAAHSL